MIVVGLITGTSADALDVAVLDLELDPDLDPDHGGDDGGGSGDGGGGVLRAEILDHREAAFPGDLRREILGLLGGEPVDLARVARVDAELGRFGAETVAGILDEYDHGCDLVAWHGQTVHHLVEDGAVAGSLQIGQPAWIAERIGVPVISDVRAADIAAGGQGAPLVSLLDRLLVGASAQPTVLLNLGGIANLTVLGAGDPTAYDTGPANALIDLLARRITGTPDAVDLDGALAAAGTVHPGLLADLLGHPYFAAAPPKSSGKELFNAAFLDRVLARHPDVAPLDQIATVTRLTARSVAEAIHRSAPGVATVYASGGGVRNPTLIAALADELGESVELAATDRLGVPAEAKEAVLMALLGWLAWHGLPGSLPACTGARHRTRAGRITPGAAPLRLPPPHPRMPGRLVVRTRPTPSESA